MARIVHVTTVHALRDPRIFYRQVPSLLRARYDVHLVAQHGRSETVEGVPVEALSENAPRLVRLVEAYRKARALEADVYHLHDPELIPVGYALRRATDACVIYDMHEDYAGRHVGQGRLIRAVERWGFTWLDHVVVANAEHRPIVRGVASTVIENYVRPLPPAEAVVQRSAPLQAPIRLLYAGVIAERRGLTWLLDVAARIREAGLPWTLDLVGVCYRRADREAAEARIQQEGLGEVVRRIGWDAYVPWPEMVASFLEADIGLILWPFNPSHAGKIPTKLYEYLHFGLPILASDFPLWRAFIEGQRCGTIVAPGDAEGVIAQVRAWYQNPAAYIACSAAASTVAPRYHWGVVEGRLLALYASLLTGARAPRR